MTRILSNIGPIKQTIDPQDLSSTLMKLHKNIHNVKEEQSSSFQSTLDLNYPPRRQSLKETVYDGGSPRDSPSEDGLE